ncbi:DivIVA domain-containing protein [Phycicoccus sp. MAQZ13P-2]|uniref:DivIVA domain-containing protein n=1 Tax=Phycicoccus mangrovi TaxID=2840470 RepID=UPI001C000C83|nr:DivIVA domain-containing protein [Phycicoccus mangrovi]MBT9254020.1 DivIVA domain-containing protein [Phycicoccus mangrovi]MBT9275567.1 DivIVA domain-containing protein [Phycicoccus mangrovi]
MTWSVLAAVLGVVAVLGAAWWLGRQRPDDEVLVDDPRPGTYRTAFRGYRTDQVDEVVDRLEARIAEREAELRVLRGEAPPAPAAPTGPGEDEPPPRGRPAPGRDPVAGRPAPLRRTDLLAPLAYLLVAAYVTMHLLGAVRTGYLSQGVQDQQAFEWYFGATAHNLATLSNPLLSDLQNFPAGVNLMANAAVLGLGVPLAPLTLLAGPEVTFVLVELLGLALTASGWYWLVRRRLAVHPLAAFLAGLLAGFGPGMVSHANGHPNFVVQALVPVVVDRVLRLAEGRRPVRDGVVLGLLVAWQVLVGEEVLLLTAVGLLVGGVVWAAHGRVRWRPLLTGGGVAGLVALVLVGFPLWWQFLGPQSYASIWHPPGGNDLAQLWGRATRTVGADPWASAALSMNRTEENSFFGVALWVAVGLTVVALWRSVVVRALAVVVVVTCWLSLGEEVTLHGTALGIPGPWALLELVPVVQNVLPTRFTLVALPVLGVLLALGVEHLRRAVDRLADQTGPGLALGLAAGVVALLPVVPTPLVVDPRPVVPAFFTQGTWRDHVDDGGSVLAVPPPNVADARALEWQAAARWGFPVVAGYFVGPNGSPDRGGQYGATPTGLTVWLAQVAQADVVVPASAQERAGFVENLRDGRVDAVVLPDDRPAAGSLRDSLVTLLGDPQHLDGVYLWDVRRLTDGAG